MAAALASFNTSSDSMSLGLMLFISLVGNPSITYKGFALLTVPTPRTRTIGDEPGDPLLVTVTPATLPCNAWPIFTTGCIAICSEDTDEIAPVTEVLFCVP